MSAAIPAPATDVDVVMGAEDGSPSGAAAPDGDLATANVTSEGGADSDGPSDGLSADERYQQRLGERLRVIRRSRGMRLQDVEVESGGKFKAVVVGSYERGDRAVSAHKLAGLADFYGVPVTELLPDDQRSRSTVRDDGIRLAVDRLRAEEETPETAPLLRLVQHVQWLRGDYSGRSLNLRGDDLRTVSVALGIQPDALATWLEERGLLVS